jgi:hypothetical protein
MDHLEEQPVAPETGEMLEQSRRFPMAGFVVFIALLIVGAVGLYTWYYLYSPCGVNNVKKASSRLTDQATAYNLAFQATRGASASMLMGPITQMEQVLINTREITVPACLQTAKIELVTAMEDTLRAFLAYMEQKPEATVKELVEESTTHLENFSAELEAINKCAPLCW